MVDVQLEQQCKGAGLHTHRIRLRVFDKVAGTPMRKVSGETTGDNQCVSLTCPPIWKPAAAIGSRSQGKSTELCSASSVVSTGSRRLASRVKSWVGSIREGPASLYFWNGAVRERVCCSKLRVSGSAHSDLDGRGVQDGLHDSSHESVCPLDLLGSIIGTDQVVVAHDSTLTEWVELLNACTRIC